MFEKLAVSSSMVRVRLVQTVLTAALMVSWIVAGNVGLAQTHDEARTNAGLIEADGHVLIWTGGELLSIDGNVFTAKGGNQDKLMTFTTDSSTRLCLKGRQVKSLQAFKNLVGKIITIYIDAHATPKDDGSSYALRVEDGALGGVWMGGQARLLVGRCESK